MQHQILLRQPSTREDAEFPWVRYIIFVSLITAGMTCPALLWYASVSLAPVSDVTAIFNTHAFWAYLLSTALIPPQDGTSRWQLHKLFAVLLACAGVFATVYGSVDDGQNTGVAATPSTSTALLGNLLTTISAISYALYQVAYKKYAVPDAHREEAYEPLQTEEGDVEQRNVTQEDPLPFGLFANFITSTAGIATLGALWIPIAVMQWTGGGNFELPPDGWTTACVAAIAVSGLTFNAGFMILLSLWGPIVASVGNLLTIVLVMFVDVLISGLSVVTIWSLLGSGLIIAGFTILVLDNTAVFRL
ncbi:transmembrane protein [Ceratobasidium sp. AG-Ba]|nr:transmembrane protein [Ceratobasidium sp. AG-Ba]